MFDKGVYLLNLKHIHERDYHKNNPDIFKQMNIVRMRILVVFKIFYFQIIIFCQVFNLQKPKII